MGEGKRRGGPRTPPLEGVAFPPPPGRGAPPGARTAPPRRRCLRPPSLSFFANKEDIVLQDGYDPLIAGAVRARPAHESSLTAVRRGLADAFADVYQGDVEAIRQRTALILSVPGLKARSREQLDSLVTHLSNALSERSGRSDTDLDIEVAASTCAAVLDVAVGRWVREGGDLPSHVDAAFVALGDLPRRPRR